MEIIDVQGCKSALCISIPSPLHLRKYLTTPAGEYVGVLHIKTSPRVSNKN
jgi:hypothetical protein